MTNLSKIIYLSQVPTTQNISFENLQVLINWAFMTKNLMLWDTELKIWM